MELKGEIVRVLIILVGVFVIHFYKGDLGEGELIAYEHHIPKVWSGGKGLFELTHLAHIHTLRLLQELGIFEN